MDARKRLYEPPAVRRLGGVEAGQGGSLCADGSSDIGNCTTGNAAGWSCTPTGNSASYDCGSGNDGGA